MLNKLSDYDVESFFVLAKRNELSSWFLPMTHCHTINVDKGQNQVIQFIENAPL